MTAMIELEALYRETDNPVYAWEALLAVPLDEPLPGWVREYLAEAGTALLEPHIPPERALDRVPAALGLSKVGRGGNMFEAARQVEREARVTVKYDTLRRRGLKSDTIVVTAARQLGVDISTVRRWMKRARRRWKAQEKGTRIN